MATTAQGTTTFAYDPLGRRIAKESARGKTLFGWDGDTLAFESSEKRSVHYVHEAGSFVPLAQATRQGPIALTASVSAKELMGSNGRYDIDRDPLWNGQAEAQTGPGFNREEIAYYQVDHLGTPQELTDHEGSIAWSAQYKAWGQAREVISDAARKAGISNPIRFQGQYYDEETGLHYNRMRYYDPSSGRFVSRDPIGLEGGLHLHYYAPNPTQWVDPLGLAKQCTCGCGPYMDQDAKWRDVKNDPNTPAHVRGWIKHQERQVALGKQAQVKAPPGYDLKHRKGCESESGFDYSHTDPALRADHQGIHHRYYRKRGGSWTVAMPKSGSQGTGKLSVPKPGALP